MLYSTSFATEITRSIQIFTSLNLRGGGGGGGGGTLKSV